MIYIRTCAYNAEKTIARTIQSVLDQTYASFIYYILDNGSIDGTGDIIRDYGKKDSRIHAFFSKKNNDYSDNIDFWTLDKRIPNGDQFCILDADDWYDANFFEEMLQFMRKNELDMAACGSIFIDSSTNEVCGGRVLQQHCILSEPASYDRYFSYAHWNFRQIWGKLYSSKAACARYGIDDRPSWYPNAYGGDTINVLKSALSCDRIGIYAKPLHNYFMSRYSISYQWIPGRIEADVILYEKTLEFLRQKCGRISDGNARFMQCVYYNSLKDTMRVLINANISARNKCEGVIKIFSHPITVNTFEANLADYGVETTEKCNWINAVYQGMEPFIKGMQGEELLKAFQNMAALCGDEVLYVKFSKRLIWQYIRNGNYSKAKAELFEWEALLPNDDDLAVYRRKML